jgi:hypothetical protein
MLACHRPTKFTSRADTSPTPLKYRVIVQGVANLLEFVEKALKDPAFDGVGCHEVEDQAFLV